MPRLMLLCLTACAACADPVTIRLDEATLVDLTHSFSSETLYWPTSPGGFEQHQLAYGDTPGGWFYSAYTFAAPEHGGTHLDAPIHFFAGGSTTDEIPLEQLVAPAVVVDISPRAADDRDAVLERADLEAFEAEHGPIPAQSIVLLRTDWDRHWGDRLAYFGDDTPGDASRLHFPGYGAEAARFLVETRRVAGLGIDTPSIDPGASADFQSHRILAAEGGIALENLTGLAQLPARGAYLIALPMKIAGGSGGPVRAVAVVPPTD